MYPREYINTLFNNAENKTFSIKFGILMIISIKIKVSFGFFFLERTGTFYQLENNSSNCFQLYL